MSDQGFFDGLYTEKDPKPETIGITIEEVKGTIKELEAIEIYKKDQKKRQAIFDLEYEAGKAERLKEEARLLSIHKGLKHLLDDLGIELEIFGCGCCHSPIVKVTHNGKVIVDEEDFNYPDKEDE